MHLITVAHLGEAQGVIEKFRLKTIEHDVFGNDEMILIITGEGPFEAAVKTSLIVSKYDFKKIINVGIAGTLTEEFKVGDCVDVRTIYLVQDLKPQFKTFKAENQGVDCVTSFERILNPEKTSSLVALGKIVDREAWGVAFAAKAAGIPFSSFKVISDLAGTIESCEVVKENAWKFSTILADRLTHVLEVKVSETQEFRLDGFHFTFTTAHKIKSLIQKLSIKFETENALELVDVKSFQQMDVSPKERTRLLIEAIEHKIDPLKKHLREVSDEVTHDFQKAGMKALIDPQWEKPKLTVSFEASNDSEIQEKILSLQKISIKKFSDTMKGQLHVE